MLALIAELAVVLIEKGLPVLQAALLNASTLSQAEKAATIERLRVALADRAVDVAGVVVLDPSDPNNLP